MMHPALTAVARARGAAALCAVAILLGCASAATNETVDTLYYEKAPAPAPGSCPYGALNATLTEEVTQGPYYLDELLFRSNVTEGQLGLPFEVRITVLDTDCNPIVGAFVDIWHCNATGTYSGYTSESPGGTLAPAAARKMLQATGATDNSTFLRGTVETDANGVAVFHTLLPGWYTGRVTHVHTMVHISDLRSGTEAAEYEDSHSAHTGQFFFEESLLDAVYQLYPYSRHTGQRTLLADDSIFASGGSDETTIFAINYASPGDLSAGLVGSATAVVNPSANHTTSFDMGGGGMGAGAPGMGGPGGQMPGPLPGGAGGIGGGALPQAAGRRLLR